MKKRIFSGMQPTYALHIGNYLGALKNWVKMQDEQKDAECIFCVVDLHANTTGYTPETLKKSTREVAAAYIAAGIDPKKSIIFPQSTVLGHAQLGWMLGCITPLGWLNRMTQFKDKAGKDKEKASAGLYTYPVLMAADVLLYHGTHVPVGDDQKQHVELMRDIAISFNQHIAKRDFFPVPEPVIMGEATRVMSLRDGTAKMSKSAESDMSRINLTDDADAIANKIKKAKTDAGVVPGSDAEFEGRPEAKNLITIYAALAETSKEKVMAEYGGQQFSAFKNALSDLTVAKMGPITSRMRELMADTAEIDRILADSTDRANAIASPVLKEATEIMGFWTK